MKTELFSFFIFLFSFLCNSLAKQYMLWLYLKHFLLASYETTLYSKVGPVPSELVYPPTSTSMCCHYCEGFGNHLVLSGEGWEVTVPGFIINLFSSFFFLFCLIFIVTFLFKGPSHDSQSINTGRLYTPLPLFHFQICL